jgi:ATP-binding cassette subfamily B protein/subfamily B ATP-binding cassette protein MsbA
MGAHRVLSGHLTVGSLLVFLAYLVTLQAQFKSLAGIYTVLQGARAGLERVMEVLETEPEVREARNARPVGILRGDVTLQNIRFGYEPERQVLQGIDLTIAAGETVAIVGATGAGKSTLALLLPRLVDVQDGAVLLDGKNVRQLRLADLRRQVVLASQESFLFPVTLMENIAYGNPWASHNRVKAAATAAAAHDFITRLSEGYDTPVGERGATLSGGERQRVALARAMLLDSPILILDEPTSALDAETEQKVIDAILEKRRGKTTILIAHRLSTARRADRIVVLEHGRLVEQGTHEALVARRGGYWQLHKLQDLNSDRLAEPAMA